MDKYDVSKNLKPGIREGLLGRPQDVKDQALISALVSREIATKALDGLMESNIRCLQAMREYIDGLPQDADTESKAVVMGAVAGMLAGVMHVKIMYREYQAAAAEADALADAAAAAVTDKGEEPPGEVSSEIEALAKSVIGRAGKG